MKNILDQLDFDFSRPLDVQRNINLEIIDNCIESLFNKDKTNIFIKHLRVLFLELYFCWVDSDTQFLSVSMSKRGYNASSRYNPNNISSYLIKVIKFLDKNNLIEFYPGFYDKKSKKSRLTRIKPSNLLINHFQRINFSTYQNINHKKKEYLLIYKGRNLHEYSDTYNTQELKATLENYNQIISKTLFDIPNYEERFLTRGDNKKIAISRFTSCTYSKNIDLIDQDLIGGCWWNKLDLNLFFNICKKLTINNRKTSFLNLTDFFGDYLTMISDSNISIQSKSFSRVLNYDQLCSLIMKGFRSKTPASFIRSVFKEKKKISLHTYTNKEINDAIINLIVNNQMLQNFMYKGKDVGWSNLVSKMFFQLISKLSTVNIPIFLVRDKIYFPSDMESIILEKIEEILTKELNINKIKFICEKASDFKFEKKNFFGKLVESDTGFSKRYLDNKKFYEVE